MEGYCIFKKNRVKLFYCIRNICDSGQSIFKHANFTEVVNSLMTYAGGKLLAFITIKKKHLFSYALCVDGTHNW